MNFLILYSKVVVVLYIVHLINNNDDDDDVDDDHNGDDDDDDDAEEEDDENDKFRRFRRSSAWMKLCRSWMLKKNEAASMHNGCLSRIWIL